MTTTPNDMNDFNAAVIEEFRANGGTAGGIFEGKPLLLLHNVGAKSGTEFVTPLVYLDDGGNRPVRPVERERAQQCLVQQSILLAGFQPIGE